MPKVAVLDMQGKEVGSVELSDAIFGIEPNANVTVSYTHLWGCSLLSWIPSAVFCLPN